VGRGYPKNERATLPNLSPGVTRSRVQLRRKEKEEANRRKGGRTLKGQKPTAIFSNHPAEGDERGKTTRVHKA